MKIVVDTNVVISGTFFGGYPGKIIEAVAEDRIIACASDNITAEYIDELIDKNMDYICGQYLEHKNLVRERKSR